MSFNKLPLQYIFSLFKNPSDQANCRLIDNTSNNAVRTEWKRKYGMEIPNIEILFKSTKTDKQLVPIFKPLILSGEMHLDNLRAINNLIAKNEITVEDILFYKSIRPKNFLLFLKHSSDCMMLIETKKTTIYDILRTYPYPKVFELFLENSEKCMPFFTQDKITVKKVLEGYMTNNVEVFLKNTAGCMILIDEKKIALENIFTMPIDTLNSLLCGKNQTSCYLKC